MDTCSDYTGASISNFILSVTLALGIVVSYIPQYVRIAQKKTSEGLSPSFLLLGSSSALFTLTNIVLVTQRARDCCSVVSTFNCISSQLSLLQIGIQSICAVLILVFVLAYTTHSLKQNKTDLESIQLVSKVVTVHSILSFFLVVYCFAINDSALYFVANLNGILSTLLTLFKYVPQIYTTFLLKHPGTLSIYMMCMQTPGGFLFTYTLIATPGSRWSSWISYGAAASLQGILLLMCIYYNHSYDTIRLEGESINNIVQDNTEDEISVP